MYPLSSADEPFRASIRDNRGVPTLLSPWEFLDDYGIVHPSGCDVCSVYMKHVADASYSPHQPAFQIAFQDRKRASEDRYNKGISEGIRRQKEEERELRDSVDHYRNERNQARDELQALRAQLDTTRADCETLQEKLRLATEPPPIATPSASASASVSVHSSSDATPPDIPPLPDPVSPSDPSSGTELLSTLFPSHHSAQMATPASPQAQLPDCVAARSFATVLSTGQPGNEDESAPQSLTDEHPVPLSWPVSPQQTHQPIKSPKSVKQVQSLIKSAHQPGNYQALARVKALCSEAHKTSRDQKTEVQRFLLSTWRTPNWDHSSSIPQITGPINNPRLEDPVESWIAYYAANPNSCPKGIRHDTDGRPFTTDMRATRTVARLRPMVLSNDPESREARQKFMTVVTALFSELGGYENILRRGAFSVSPQVNHVPYMGSVDKISKESVARHFAGCGVTIPVAENELRPWAREFTRDVPHRQ